jgi:hypothetical protein
MGMKNINRRTFLGTGLAAAATVTVGIDPVKFI